MKTKLFLILICICISCFVYVCSHDKKIQVSENNNENISEIITVTLYNDETDNYYKVKIDKNEVYKYIVVNTNNEKNNDSFIEDNNIDENKLYAAIKIHDYEGMTYSVFDANEKYNEYMNDKNTRNGEKHPDYNEDWAIYMKEYEYNNIFYTILYGDNASLEVFIKNPYTEEYDFRIFLPYIGKRQTDYINIVEKIIDNIEFTNKI